MKALACELRKQKSRKEIYREKRKAKKRDIEESNRYITSEKKEDREKSQWNRYFHIEITMHRVAKQMVLTHTVCPGNSDPPEKIFNIHICIRKWGLHHLLNIAIL